MSRSTRYYTDTNGVPKELDGRVTHLGLKNPELAPRIVTVGSLSRAKVISEQLDAKPIEYSSARGFTTFTGAFSGVAVSIVATGMGAPMMDFLVREARAIVQGPIALVRYGSCGSVSPSVKPGTVVANTLGSFTASRNPDGFRTGRSVLSALACCLPQPYLISEVQPPDACLAASVWESLREALGEGVVQGLNGSADSFYSSQGRIDPAFDDRNQDLISTVLARHPSATSMEMETFHLLHLANCSCGSIKAAAAAIVCANRDTADVITKETLHELESVGGRAVLRAITNFPLGD